MIGQTYVFMKKLEKLSLNYPQYLHLIRALFRYNEKCPSDLKHKELIPVQKFRTKYKNKISQLNLGSLDWQLTAGICYLEYRHIFIADSMIWHLISLSKSLVSHVMLSFPRIQTLVSLNKSHTNQYHQRLFSLNQRCFLTLFTFFFSTPRKIIFSMQEFLFCF